MIIMDNFLIQPRSLRHPSFTGSFQIQRHRRLGQRPIYRERERLLSVAEVDPHICSKAKWPMDPNAMT